MGRRPDKKELAKIKVMSDLGLAPTAIAKKRRGLSDELIVYFVPTNTYIHFHTFPSAGGWW